MVNNRKFIISDKLFSGYSTLIDLDEINSKEEIVNIVKNRLKNVLNENNLESLIYNLNKTNFHIHDFTFEDILLSESNKIFYVCNHDICR